MMNKYEPPYSAEIRAKYCKPEENVDFGERYCEICGCVLDFEEEDNGVIVEDEHGEQHLLSHEQYKELLKRKKKNETCKN